MLFNRFNIYIVLLLIAMFSSGCTKKDEYFLDIKPNPDKRKAKSEDRVSPDSRRKGKPLKIQDGVKQSSDNGDSMKALEHYLRVLKRNPKDLKALINAGRILSRTERNEEVIKIFNKAMKLNPKGEDLRIALICSGRAYANLKKFDQALKYLHKAVEIPGDKKLAYLNLAAVNNEMDRYIEAVNILKNIPDIEEELEADPAIRSNSSDLARYFHQLGLIYSDYPDHEKADYFYNKSFLLEPDNEFVLFERGYNNFLRGKRELAKPDIKQWLKKHLSVDTEDYESLRTMALAQAMLGGYESALIYIDGAISESPKTIDLYRDRGRIHRLMGNNKAALKDYQFVAKNGWHDSKREAQKVIDTGKYRKNLAEIPTTTKELNDLAYIYCKAGKSDMAIDILDDIVRKYPDDPMCYITKGRVFLKEKKVKKAIDLFTKGLALNPGKEEARTAYVGRAMAYSNFRRDYPKAKKDIRKALKNESPTLMERLYISNMYCEMEEFHKSVEILNKTPNLEKSLAEDPYLKNHPKELAWCYCTIGIIYSDHADYELADNYLQKCLEFDPGYINALREIAYNYFLMGKVKKARWFAREWLETNPPLDDFENVRCMSLSYMILGKYDKAIYYMNKAMKMEPEDTDLYRDRARMFYLKGDMKSAIKDYEWVVKNGIGDAPERARRKLREIKTRGSN